MRNILTTIVFAISFILSSCGNAIEGYEWLEGTWEVNDGDFNAKMTITKNKFTIESSDSRFQIKNNSINIGNAFNYYYGENGSDILALDIENTSIAIDEDNQSILLILSEYESYNLYKIEEPVKSDSQEKNRKKYKSSSNESKNLINAFNKYEYLMFDTRFQEPVFERPYYIILHPFEFSEDANQGIVYFVAYGEDKSNSYRKGIIDAILKFHGEYEIIGNNIRVRNILKGNEPIESLTYTIIDDNDNLKLFGGFPHNRTEKYTNYQVLNIPNLIIELLEKESVCRHK